nr:solute carrier family 43 member 3-like isoform X1 [Oncorhynchus nerka]
MKVISISINVSSSPTSFCLSHPSLTSLPPPSRLPRTHSPFSLTFFLSPKETKQEADLCSSSHLPHSLTLTLSLLSPPLSLPKGETKQEADLRSSSLSLFLTSLQCLLFYVCVSSPLLPLQYLTFILQVLNSAFIYGGHQAFLTIAFPGCHFGKLSGLTTSLSAVVLLLQFPVLHLIREFLHGDPIYVNVGLTLLTLLTFIHPLHVHLHCRSLASQRRARTEQEVTNSGSEVTCNRLVGM